MPASLVAYLVLDALLFAGSLRAVGGVPAPAFRRRRAGAARLANNCPPVARVLVGSPVLTAVPSPP